MARHPSSLGDPAELVGIPELDFVRCFIERVHVEAPMRRMVSDPTQALAPDRRYALGVAIAFDEMIVEASRIPGGPDVLRVLGLRKVADLIERGALVPSTPTTEETQP